MWLALKTNHLRCTLAIGSQGCIVSRCISVVGLTKTNVCLFTQGTSQQDGGSSLDYSVKVINPCKKGDYEVHKLRVNRQYSSVLELKKQLVDSLKNHIPNNMDFHVGYIEPGKQGIRGKMRWIFTEEDLADMYSVYRGKSEILLWCDGRSPEKATGMPHAKRANPGLDDPSESTVPKKSRPLTATQSKNLVTFKLFMRNLMKNTTENILQNSYVLGLILFKWTDMPHMKSHLTNPFLEVSRASQGKRCL